MVQEFVKISNSPIQFLLTLDGIEVWVKRDDLLDPFVSGNKLFKLKYNLEQAIKEGKDSLLTFGGAFSNHIAATASFANQYGLKSIGIIRGEAVDGLNPTLRFATFKRMDLKFISREAYRQKNDPTFLSELQREHPNAFIIPEGGANVLGIKGSKEILSEETRSFDTIACAIGTGTTVAGLLKACASHQKIIGIPIHKHSQIMDEVVELDPSLKAHLHHLIVETDFHFGGYAKWNQVLIEFIQTIHRDYGLKLDPIYTGKALFALIECIKNKKLKSGSKVLFVHTGGLQGVPGFEERFDLKLFDSP